MKVYTKTGDKGKTSLIGGTRVSKSEIRLDAYGTLDELNSTLGVVIELISRESNEPSARDQVKSFLNRVQNQLFDIGSRLACEKPEFLPNLPNVETNDIIAIENEIDAYTTHLRPLKNFVLPGGVQSAAMTHVARTICRRAERILVSILDHDSTAVDAIAIQYVNRLSDYLFVTARYLNAMNGRDEPLWHPSTDRK